MEQTTATWTVCFEAPFWIGVYERTTDGLYSVCKVTFGAEPKDYEVYAFFLKHFSHLQFSLPIQASGRAVRPQNAKRLHRAIGRQLSASGIGIKAQQALQREREQGKQQRTVRRKAAREANRQRQFSLRVEKRKEKHRGH